MAPICHPHSVGTWPTSTMTEEMAPGPASMGMPSGTIPASSFAAPSTVSPCVSCVGDRRASSMSRPMSSRISPPAISNAGKVMPNMRKISCPATAKLVSTMKQVSEPLRAMRLRRRGSACCVMARNEGIAANGSTRKKMELSASTEKRTMGAWLTRSMPPWLCWSGARFEARTFLRPEYGALRKR